MSPALATTLGLALYAVALLPILWAGVGRNVRSIVALYTAFLLAVAAYQTGIFHRSSLAPTDMEVSTAASADDAQCREILDLARESGLSVDRTDPAAPRIAGNGADQLPAEIRDVLLDCFERQASGGPPDVATGAAR